MQNLINLITLSGFLYFTKQETMLLNFLMIILQWYPKQNLKQLKVQDLGY